MKLELDASIYSVDAVEAAAYRFIDRLSVLISKTGNKLELEISVDTSTGMDDELLQDFKKELTDQNLRKRIRSETEQTRNLILAYTFSRSGL